MIEHIIADRLSKYAEYGPKWEGKPNDLISWAIDHAPPQHRNIEDIALKVMLINLAAIHTTTIVSSLLFPFHVVLICTCVDEHKRPLRPCNTPGVH